MPPPPLVLVVDDEVDIREVLAEVLREEGYAAATAANGREALQLLDGGLRPGLVLLDLMMPVMTGWQFLEQVRARPSLAEGLRVLAFSATARQLEEAAPLVGIVAKPSELGTLLRHVATHLPRAED